MNIEKVNLIYYKDSSKNGNFGVELSVFITKKLINKDKYELVINQENIPLNILCIGSYIHCAVNNAFIFGSGIRTPNNIEKGHKYNNLNICSVRGPLSREFLLNVKKVNTPEIYGDPGLLLPKFYKPLLIKCLNDYNSSLLYKNGNNINLDNLIKTFPFS